MLKLEFNGQIYEVGFQKESLRKPSQRLVKYNPFEHYSSLYCIEIDGEKSFFFDYQGKAYRWLDLEDPKGFIQIPVIEYLELKGTWYRQQRERMNKKILVSV